MNIFLAGAAGVIGQRLVPLLIRAGHTVSGTTRSQARAATLERLGAQPVVVDVFDADALAKAMAAAAPEVVIHQLTDLPNTLDPAAMDAVLAANARLRDEGTRNLIVAAKNAGARRVVAQSIAFAYAPKTGTLIETDPLAADQNGRLTVTAQGVQALEEQVLGTMGIDGLVLRYGQLYGPGTWTPTPPQGAPLHVDAAAHAALLAVTRGSPGIYNVAEDDGAVSSERAKRELGIDTSFRLSASA